MGSQDVSNQGVSLCRGEAVTEYFRGLVEDALDRQGVDVEDLTAYYVVQMLATFSRTDAKPGEAVWSDAPLAIRLGRALETGGARQRLLLRQVGDASLFIAGFFPDRLRRSLVDAEYYASLGGYAYGSLSRIADEALAPVFGELAAHFDSLVDVLGEVSERTALSSPNDLLRLYERWVRTGSAHAGQRLVEQGVVPTRATSRLLQ
jgi:hypothetical protein